MNPMVPFLGENVLLVLVLLVWTAFWKGYAMWTAVKKDQTKWFVALLILNTFGLLEIIYIFFVAKKNWSDIKALFHSKKSE